MGTISPNSPAPFNLTAVDRQILSMTDEEFVPHNWENLKELIARNALDELKRKPSDLRRYMAWSSDTKAVYGSITNYICQERLRWHEPEQQANPAEEENGARNKNGGVPTTATATAAATVSATATADSRPVIPYKNPVPFADPEDYRVLRNDWPYGLAPGITHLVVWLKTPVAVKSEDGDVTDESRSLIENFVQRTFVDRLKRAGFANPKEQVLWFKNPVGLQSVRALEHVHVLVRDVPDEIIEEWTGERMERH
ncbi:hypothetical protein C8Q69DRAFT_469600 [Paecilomyces variotii]|uniref:Uncharacterized protein n=1 Tax=Byssochlamys spectabilis TaxID=264951 RepID=A0A443HTY0_BYSSP|nr:hypothetical protein C8Q69DRAFT_469600 [Paecilomyces variotii]KAJ9348652.1 hypothetical protein DTO280E4_9277 [Paecilomyces variotii]RWQ95281.1 hypothetical protein C8Q69DRAFT_469600 [Paecilomyces variotii]